MALNSIVHGMGKKISVLVTLIMHGAVRLHVQVLLVLLEANGVSHLTTDHFARAMHCDVNLQHFSHYTMNALRKGHVHVNGLDVAEWSHSSLTIHGSVIHVTFSTVPNVRKNCMDGVLYASSSVSNDAF